MDLNKKIKIDKIQEFAVKPTNKKDIETELKYLMKIIKVNNNFDLGNTSVTRRIKTLIKLYEKLEKKRSGKK